MQMQVVQAVEEREELFARDKKVVDFLWRVARGRELLVRRGQGQLKVGSQKMECGGMSVQNRSCPR